MLHKSEFSCIVLLRERLTYVCRLFWCLPPSLHRSIEILEKRVHNKNAHRSYVRTDYKARVLLLLLLLLLLLQWDKLIYI